MKISVVGCGRWGSFIAWYLDLIEHNVTLYGRENSKNMIEFQKTRKNNYLTLQDSVKLSTNLDETFDEIDYLIISVGVQNLRKLLLDLKDKIYDTNVPLILCMKGIEMETGLLPTEIVSEVLGKSQKVAVWIGPGHVQDFTRGIPNCMVIDSEDEELKSELVDMLSSSLIRFYYGNDLIGNQIGAASKNVIGIAAGVLDGLNLSSLKGALMSRGAREVSRLIGKMGGDEISAYGLCHLGDYEATVFSEFSNNRRFGEAFVKKEKFEKLAEGYYTTVAMLNLSKKYDVELPITEAIYSLIYEDELPDKIIEKLFKRSLKSEF